MAIRPYNEQKGDQTFQPNHLLYMQLAKSG